jgi:hypothetical protein
MDSTPLPVDRHSAATFQPGARVYDQVTRAFGTVKGTQFVQTLKPADSMDDSAKRPSIFSVPASSTLQMVSVLLDGGIPAVRRAEQLHDSPGAIAAGLVDFNRPKAGG